MMAELQSIIHEETAFAVFRLRRKYFESGDKAGKMLALWLKQLQNRHSISHICKSTGEVIYEQTNHIFSMLSSFQRILFKALPDRKFHKRERDGIFLSGEKQESAAKDYPDQGREVDWESQMFIFINSLIMLGFLCCGLIQTRVRKGVGNGLRNFFSYPKTN